MKSIVEKGCAGRKARCFQWLRLSNRVRLVIGKVRDVVMKVTMRHGLEKKDKYWKESCLYYIPFGGYRSPIRNHSRTSSYLRCKHQADHDGTCEAMSDTRACTQ